MTSRKPYEILPSNENLPPRRRILGKNEKRKVSMQNSQRYTSPRRINSKNRNQLAESTAKKNHSSSSQVNNFSREEQRDSSENKNKVVGRNIHMRETFKCGEEQERLGFSFLHRQQEKESLALWKNVSMPLASPKHYHISHSRNKENELMSHSKQTGHNPFNDSRESKENQINSSKTKLIKFQASPNSMNFLSEENNIVSLTHNRVKSIKKSVGQPIWKDSPLSSFNQIQSFPSGNQKPAVLFDKTKPNSHLMCNQKASPVKHNH